jgi:hypothetical protein
MVEMRARSPTWQAPSAVLIAAGLYVLLSGRDDADTRAWAGGEERLCFKTIRESAGSDDRRLAEW